MSNWILLLSPMKDLMGAAAKFDVYESKMN